MITLFNIANAIICGSLALTCGIVGNSTELKAYGVLGFIVVGLMNTALITYCL